jgi:hypothetical protein
VPVQAASGALFLNSSDVTVYNSLFDHNEGKTLCLPSTHQKVASFLIYIHPVVSAGAAAASYMAALLRGRYQWMRLMGLSCLPGLFKV